MATFYQTQTEEAYPIQDYADSIEKEGSYLFSKFRQLLNSYTFFHVSFFLVFILELAILSISIFSYKESIAFIITLASTLLTLFSYFILGYYFQGKKIEQFKELKVHFYQACRKHVLPALPDEEVHLAIAKCSFQLCQSIGQRRIYALSLPPFEFVKDFFLKSRFIFIIKMY